MSGPQHAGAMTPEQHYVRAEEILAGMADALSGTTQRNLTANGAAMAQVAAICALAHATLATAIF